MIRDNTPQQFAPGNGGSGSARIPPARAVKSASNIGFGWRLLFGVWMGMGLMFLSRGSLAAAPSVEAQLDRAAIALGETVTFSIIVHEGQPVETPSPRLPAEVQLIENHQSQSTQIDVTRGRMVSTITLGYVLQPSRTGEFILPSVAVRLADRVLSTAPVKLTVNAADAARNGSESAAHALLRLHVAKTNVFVGEQVPVQVQLFYQQADINQMPQLPAEGFTMGPMPQPRRGRSRAGEREFSVLVFDTVLSPIKTGPLTVGPAQMNIIVRIPTERRARDVFEEFFDMGARLRRQPMKLSSDPVVLNVMPLPTKDQPPSFSGAVGQFTWTVSASPTNLTVGDPLTLKIQVSGEGNLDGLNPPTIAGNDFKAYPANARVETTDPLGAKGNKFFEQVLAPQHARVTQIPELTWSFFDPVRQIYQTLRHPAVPLTVAASAAPLSVVPGVGPAPSASGATSQPEPPTSRPIGAIKPELGLVLGMAPPFRAGRAFWLIQCFPVVVWFGARIWSWRRGRWAANPRLQRRQALEASLDRGLRELLEHADRNDGTAFFATTFRLLQDTLGERLDVPSGGITESILDARLPALGADAELIRELHELFALCHQARYAGQGSGREQHAHRPRIEAILRRVSSLQSGVPARSPRSSMA